MCFFGGGGSGGSGPQSSADMASGGYKPPVKPISTPTSGGNPHSDAATPQGKSAEIMSKQTADRNTMRRADSYGSRNKGATKVASALSSYSNAQTNKTILGS